MKTSQGSLLFVCVALMGVACDPKTGETVGDGDMFAGNSGQVGDYDL